MARYKKYIFILVGSLAILSVAAVFAFNYVPILKVEGKAATYSEFLKVYNAFKTYDLVSQKTHAEEQELKRRALASLIDDKFLEIIVQKTNTSLKLEAEQNVEKAILEMKEGDFSLEEAANKLYGLSAADFKKFVLIPEAEKDLLVKHYEYNPSELDDLWAFWARNAKVKIYYPGYEWRDGEVKIK